MTPAELLQQTIVREVSFGDVMIKVRLAPLDLWIKQGKVPSFFQETYLKATGGYKDLRPVSDEEAERNGREELAFREQVVRYCLVSPAIAPEGQEPAVDEMTLEQVQQVPGLYEFVYGFGIFRGLQSVVNTKGGGIKADDLATFRAEAGQPAGAGSDSGAVLTTSVSTAGSPG